jgi:hypothetical protein
LGFEGVEKSVNMKEAILDRNAQPTPGNDMEIESEKNDLLSIDEESR